MTTSEDGTEVLKPKKVLKRKRKVIPLQATKTLLAHDTADSHRTTTLGCCRELRLHRIEKFNAMQTQCIALLLAHIPAKHRFAKNLKIRSDSLLSPMRKRRYPSPLAAVKQRGPLRPTACCAVSSEAREKFKTLAIFRVRAEASQPCFFFFCAPAAGLVVRGPAEDLIVIHNLLHTVAQREFYRLPRHVHQESCWLRHWLEGVEGFKVKASTA